MFRAGEVVVEYIQKPAAKKARLIQGLLGVGHVGLLASRQLLHSLGARKVASIYFPEFIYPGSAIPGVVHDKDGAIDLERNELYYDEKSEIFILTGLYQAITPEGYFKVANKVLEICSEFGVKELYTIGGIGVGKEVPSPQVFAVIPCLEIKEELEKQGIKIAAGGEGMLGVTGLAGILVAMAAKNNIRAACLLGETHGGYPDPRAAKQVLLKLGSLLNLQIPTEDLDKHIEAMEKELKNIEDYAKKMREAYAKEEKKAISELPYIG